jgi:hypothetical protein
MKMVNKYAEVQLFTKADALSQQFHETWRCIHINLAGKKNRVNAGARKNFVTGALNELLSSKDGTIYVCDDGDVFVLFQGQLSPVMKILSGHFGELEASAQHPQAATGPFTVFDLSRQFQEFFTLCENKHLRAIIESEVMRAQVAYQQHANVTAEPLSQ